MSAIEPCLGMIVAHDMHSLAYRFDAFQLGRALLPHAVWNFLLGLCLILAQDWVFW